jgi:hypothetical protein
MVAVSAPLLAGWIVASALSGTDLFTGPFFWVFTYLLVVGIGLFSWGTAETSSRSRRGVRLGSRWTVLLEELALGAASFLLFSAFVGR